MGVNGMNEVMGHGTNQDHAMGLLLVKLPIEADEELAIHGAGQTRSPHQIFTCVKWPVVSLNPGLE